MSPTQVRCLVLACGNTLRGDDGVGPWLAAWAGQEFAANRAVRVVARHQWTPDLAEEIARAESVIFVDCAVNLAPGKVRVEPVDPASTQAGLATHQMGAPALLALSQELYASLPRNAVLLSIGAGSLEMGETFSDSVKRALPGACSALELEILRALARSSR